MNQRGPIEAALSTDQRGEPYTFALWDIYTGTQIVVFKGSKSSPTPKCLQLIDNNYFITASENVIQIWSIFNRKCQDTKLFLPGRPTTLCTSPCGNYLAVGIGEMIYIWQLHSGNLVSHSQRHYQAVSVLKFNQDGSFLISGGEDGIVLVWPFAETISASKASEPRFTWQHHSAQVTDIHISNGGLCITSSADSSINIYSYSTGKRLNCVTFPSPLWSVVMNKNETTIYLGAQDGNIYEVAVSSMSLAIRAGAENGTRKPILKGHKGKIVSMLVSADGTRLISASLDSTCKIWDLRQGKLLQDIKHQAPLANLTSLLVPEALSLSSVTQSQAKPPLPVKPLKRNVFKLPRESSIGSEDLFEEASTVVVNIRNQVDQWTSDSANTIPDSSLPDLRTVNRQDDEKEINDQFTLDPNLLVERYKEKMKALYLLSAEKIFQDAAHESLKPFKTDSN